MKAFERRKKGESRTKMEKINKNWPGEEEIKKRWKEEQKDMKREERSSIYVDIGICLARQFI